jgi:type I restriction enzyme M protein
VTSGALFRTVGLDSLAREDLIGSQRLHGVFSVPSRVAFLETGIQTALLALTASDAKVDLVRLVDLSHERFATSDFRGRHAIRPKVSWLEALKSEIGPGETWGIDVGRVEIREQDNILSVDRYLNTGVVKALKKFLANQAETRPLGDLFEIIRPIPVRPGEDGEIKIFEASIGDIGEDGYVVKPTKSLCPERSAVRAARNQQIRPGDVVLSIRGTIGAAGIAPDEAAHGSSEELWTAGQSLVILRPRSDRLLPVVLYEYLSNEIVREYIQSLAGGAALITLNLRDLQRLGVPVPSREEQAGIEEGFYDRQKLFEQIAKLRGEITSRRATGWPHGNLRS